jgi:hypothetical protein
MFVKEYRESDRSRVETFMNDAFGGRRAFYASRRCAQRPPRAPTAIRAAAGKGVVRDRPVATITPSAIAVITTGTAAIHHRPKRKAAHPTQTAKTTAPTGRILRVSCATGGGAMGRTYRSPARLLATLPRREELVRQRS